MFGGLRQIREGEGRDTFVAAASLFTLLAGHAVLETARDALFLAHIDAAQLPFVYIGVAIAAMGVATLQDRGPSGRSALASWLVLSGGVTAGFYPLIGTGEWVLYALYIWSAVVVTVALTRLFLLLGERFTVSQAKRLYAVIGAGSVLGAIVGSGAAGLLATLITPRQLLLVGASALIVSAAGPLALSSRDQAKSESPEAAAESPSPMKSARTTFAHPYARRVAVLMVLSTLTFTLVDFVFKSQVASSVAPEDLGAFFGRVYFVLNVASLFVQLFVVQWLLRVGGPTRALALLPGLLALGGVGALFGGGLPAAVALKGADGGLRHSLHRTASELLYVPMGGPLRRAAKTFIDIIGHRGGQAAASLTILAVGALGIDPEYLGAAVALLAGAAVVVTLELRSHYLDVFRGTLADAAQRKEYAFPELNLTTLESLLATLNSPDEKRVEVALELFAEQGRAHLIPGLILYHPAPDVLAKALELLAETGRTDFLPLADRLLDHEYAHVRAAALRARMKLAPDEALLRRKVEVTCPVVRATALVGLTAGGYASVEETAPYLEEVVKEGSPVAREALARAIGYGLSGAHDDYLILLAQSEQDEVLLSVARSMRLAPNPRFIPRLIPMLARRKVRHEALGALVALEETALGVLEGALTDEGLSVAIRRNVPRAISMFPPERAAGVLTAHISDVHDGAVRYRILRALNRLVSENPNLKLDRKRLDAALEQNLSRAFCLLDWRLTLERGADKHAGRQTTAHGLLVTMLRDKELNSRERMLRLLGALHPEQNVRTIARGLRSPRAEVAASSRELLESFVPSRFRTAVLGLVDDLPDPQRLQSAGTLHQPVGLDYVELLRVLLDTDSDSLRSLAVYHIGELGLSELRATVEELDARPESSLATVVRQTIAQLSGERKPAT